MLACHVMFACQPRILRDAAVSPAHKYQTCTFLIHQAQGSLRCIVEYKQTSQAQQVQRNNVQTTCIWKTAVMSTECELEVWPDLWQVLRCLLGYLTKGLLGPSAHFLQLHISVCHRVSSCTQVLANWTVMFSDLHESHIPAIGSNVSNFTTDFCESGAFGARLSAPVGLKLALLNPVHFASPICTVKSGAHVSQASRHDFYVSNPQFVIKLGLGLTAQLPCKTYTPAQQSSLEKCSDAVDIHHIQYDPWVTKPLVAHLAKCLPNLA